MLTRGQSKRLEGGEGFQEYSEKDGDFAWVEVRGAKDLDIAVESALRKDHKFVVVDCTNWKIIPLENLIGEFRRKHRKIYAFMKSEGDIKLAFSILEKGVDGVVIPYSSLKASKELIASVTSAADEQAPSGPAREGEDQAHSGRGRRGEGLHRHGVPARARGRDAHREHGELLLPGAQRDRPDGVHPDAAVQGQRGGAPQLHPRGRREDEIPLRAPGAATRSSSWTSPGPGATPSWGG